MMLSIYNRSSVLTTQGFRSMVPRGRPGSRDEEERHPMPRLTESADYGFAQAHYAPEKLCEFFDGDRAALNITHECIDRHATDGTRPAVRIARADGRDEVLTFRAIADASSR